MPLAKSRTPDGQEFQFYAPRGLSPEALSVAAENAYYRMLEGIDVTQPPPVESTIGGEFKRGLELAASGVQTAGQALFGDEEEAAREALAREEDIRARYGAGPKSFAELREQAKNEGILSALGTGIGQLPEVISGQGAQLLGTAAAAGLGTLAAGPGGGVTAAGASLLPQFAGANIAAQARAQEEAGQELDINTGKAFGTAALQAVPELIGQRLLLGKGVVNKILGIETEKLTTAAARKAAADKLLATAERGFLATTGRGVATGIAGEVPTEVTQQILERAQAGQDLLSPEALAEYGEAAFTAATVGGSLGPIGSLGDRSAARSRVEALKAAGIQDVKSVTDIDAALALPPATTTAPTTVPEEDDLSSIQGTATRAAVRRAEAREAALAGPTAPAAETPTPILDDFPPRRPAEPQGELFNYAQAPLPPRAPTTLTAEFLTSIGVPRASALIRGSSTTPSIVGKDLTDPAQRDEVAATITQYLKNPMVTARGSNQGINLARLLKSPVFAEATVESAAQPTAPQQLTIEDKIETAERVNRLRQEEAQLRERGATEYPLAGALSTEEALRAAQQKRSAQLIAAREQKALESAAAQRREEAARRQAEQEAAYQELENVQSGRPIAQSAPPAVGAALQRAEARGRPVPGQKQMEFPTIPPADPLDQALAAEQRAIEQEQAAQAVEPGAETAPVQEEMFGPRGGVPRRRKAAPVEPEAAPVEPEAVEPVAEAKDEREAARIRRERAQAKAQKNQAKAKQAESARKAAVAAEAAGRTQRTETANAKSKNDALFDIADELVNGTEAGKKAAQDRLDSLDDADYDNVAFYTNHMRFDEGMDLPASALSRTAGAVDKEVLDALKQNKLADALAQMAKTRNKSISRVATALARVAGNTKVRFEADLKNDKGETIAGKFEPSTNTVVFNANFVPTNHVVLHEVLHAATAAELANTSSPNTRQLQKLFDAVKDRLDTAYGASSLDEFVVEAFSNPEFQAKLAELDTKGDRISVWTRFKTIVNNIVRKLLGMSPKGVNSVRDEMDKIVMEMLAPAPEFRGAADLHSATMDNIGKDLLNVVGKAAKGDVTKEDIAVFNDYMPGLSSTARKSILSVLPLNSIADYIAPQFPKLSQEIKALFRLIQQKNGTRQRYITKVRDTANQLEKLFDKLPKEQRELFNDVVMESTLERVDPSKGREYYSKYRFSFVRDDGTEFRSGPFDTAEARNAAIEKAVADNNLRKNQIRPANPSKGTLEAYDRVEAIYKKLRPEAQQAYGALRDAYSEAFTILRKTLVARIESIDADKNLKQNYKDRILFELLNKESIEPYFPLYRKGDYWLSFKAKDPNTGNVEFYKQAYPTLEERIRARRELEKDPSVELDTVAEEMRPDISKRQRTGTVDPQFAYNLLGDVRANAAKYESAAKKKVKDAGGDDAAANKAGKAARDGAAELETVVMDALLTAMPERSLFRAFKSRKDIRGAENDALLVFRERMPAFMGQVSNLELDAPFNKIKNNLTELANEQRGTDDGAYATEIAELAKEYADFARSPSLAPWARKLKSLGFAMTLGLNVSSALVNLFTLPMAVYPYLAGKHGYGKTMSAMNRARKLYMATGTRRTLDTFEGVEGGTAFDGPSFTNIDFSKPDTVPESFKKLGAEELRRNKILVDVMNQQGMANATTISDLLEMNTAGNSITDKANSVMGYAFHQGERFTRQVTMKATYDLLLDEKAKSGKPLTDEDYVAAAHEAVLETEHTNSGSMLETAPKIAQNSLGSVLLMYKRFGISMVYLQLKMAKQALKGATPEERKYAKKQLLGLFAMSGILSGIQGVPMMGLITELANMFLLDDEDEDADSILASYFGEGMYSGLVNSFGLDIAPRIGMSNLIFRSLPNQEQESLVMQGIEMAGGPIVGIAQRMLDQGLPLLQEGEIARGMEKMLPSVAANAMKAARYATEGATTLRGDPITEDFGPLTILGQTLGFAPAGYTRQLEINARDKRVDRVITENRTKLLRKRYKAMRENDIDEFMAIEEDIDEFNTRHPEVRITADTKERSVRQHRVTDEVARMFNGITISPQRRATVMRRQLEDLDEGEFFE